MDSIFNLSKVSRVWGVYLLRSVYLHRECLAPKGSDKDIHRINVDIAGNVDCFAIH